MALCPAPEIDKVWAEASPLIQEATKYSNGRHEVDDLYWMIAREDAQLWIVSIEGKIVASCVSTIQPYPCKNMLNVLFVGGTHMSEWLSVLIDKLKRFAAFNQAEGIEMAGRKGWSRILHKYDFKVQDAVLMELSI